MKILNLDKNQVMLRLSKDEFGVLRGCSSHVLQNFAMPSDYNITESTGLSRQAAELIATNLRESYRAATETHISYAFSRDEILFLIKTIEDTVKKIGSEFYSLIGRTTDEAMATRNALQDVALRMAGL